MALTYPFIDLQIIVGEINVPVVDAVALIGFFLWGVQVVWWFFTDPKKVRHIHWWGLWVFAAWAVVCFASLFNSFDWISRLKYVLRPLLFFYPVFVLYPLNVMTRPRVLRQVFWILFVAGIVIALYGLYGFATIPVQNFLDRRVFPVPIFGTYPMGANHNLIADVMVTTIPVGFYLLMTMKQRAEQKLVFLGLLLLVFTNALTFSRSGWLAFGVEMIMLLLIQYRHHMKKIVRYSVLCIVFAMPLIVYMLIFSLQDTVQSSNQNRLILNDIALEMFKESPWLGTGPGTFIGFVERNHVYILEFGRPLDAHGFIQKVGSELGLLGLIMYLSMLGYVLYRVYKGYRRAAYHSESSYLLASMCVMIAGTVFFQLFQTSYFVAKLWFPLGVALAATAIVERYTHEKQA